MRKNFRAVKVSLIMGILLVSVFAIMLPVSSVKAQGLFGFASVVDIEWLGENESVIVKPNQEYGLYRLRVTYQITKGPFGGLIYAFLYVGKRVDIKLEIIDFPREWSEVLLPTDTLTFSLRPNLNEIVEKYLTLQISVTEDAPAFRDGKISIRATVNKIGLIREFDKTLQLNFKSDYLPLLGVIPETQHKLIGPMDTAEIPIRVTNLGNARTDAQFRVTNVPEGWIAIVTDKIILETKQTDNIFLTVKPPKSFGYHDEYETIVIEYTPRWAENVQVRGITEIVTVAVESRGISVIGIEVILPIIVLIILVIFAIYYLYKQMKRK